MESTKVVLILACVFTLCNVVVIDNENMFTSLFIHSRWHWQPGASSVYTQDTRSPNKHPESRRCTASKNQRGKCSAFTYRLSQSQRATQEVRLESV